VGPGRWPGSGNLVIDHGSVSLDCFVCSLPASIASIPSSFNIRKTREVIPSVTCRMRWTAQAERTQGCLSGRLRMIASANCSKFSSGDHRGSGYSSKRRDSWTSPLIASFASFTPKQTRDIFVFGQRISRRWEGRSASVRITSGSGRICCSAEVGSFVRTSRQSAVQRIAGYSITSSVGDLRW
jgi:hypothetical protein